jgi:hypothetical protein
MMMLRASGRFGIVAGVSFLTSVAAAGTVTLTPSVDNTLYQTSSSGEEVSNALGPHIYVGKTNGNQRRRGLIRFDLSTIPAGSTIDSVELRMTCNRGAGAGFSYSLYRVTSDWGQGNSIASDPGGTGAPATPNDPTWLSRSFGASLWNTAGGDFDATPSASTIMVTPGSQVVWASTPGLVADVQAWLNDTSQNFGWIIIGGEGSLGTAVRLSSRDSSTARPSLVITYSTPPACGTSDFNGDGDFGTDQDIEAFFACLAGNCCASCFPGGSDFNQDGDFGTDQDIESFFRVLGGGPC